MTVPDYYSSLNLVIRVDPDNLFAEMTVAVPGYGGNIADSVARIANIWNGLKLGWVGTTAGEAQDFNRQWIDAITSLYGTKDDPNKGVLTQIANLVASAGFNYAQSEQIVTKMFTDFSDALSQQSGSPDGSRNVTGGPINEVT